MDRTERSGRIEGRGILAGPPGADRQSAWNSRTLETARTLDEELRARQIIRRRRAACSGVAATRAAGRSPDGSQSARQWRAAQARAQTAGFPRLCRRHPSSRRCRRRSHPRARQVLARGRQAQRSRAQFPHHGARRDRIQPARRGVRGHRPGLDGRHRALRRPPRP
ncbi:hypothetical protein chiPu_0033564 [Chiloscyllium punctatum]|uniref:Uncharacterized protein n=1 Tax=Chiloscyllium punctatum TaxID=137246 RepID=A0A401U3C7_CHIPU|nr:hypothetical protein [Chiloscyllium punctatum]